MSSEPRLRREHRRHAFWQCQLSPTKAAPPIVDLPAGRAMLAGDRRHLHSRHQALGRNPGSVGFRANPPSGWTFQNLEPACVASCWDVQLDVHFAVCSHVGPPSLAIGGILGTFTSRAARGERRGAYDQTIVVFEATRSCDTCLGHALAAVERKSGRVNPQRARDFARVIGRLAKTDAIDAAMLAEMGRAL